PEMTEKTYDALLEQAGTWLADANTVVLDGAFCDEGQRSRLRELAARTGTPLRFIYCDVSVPTARQRVRQRREKGADLSDAPEHLPAKQKNRLGEGTDLTDPDVIRIDAGSTPDDSL